MKKPLNNNGLKVKNLTFAFEAKMTNKGKRSLLNNISFEVKNSEIVAILGPSGCGKTTLLNLISGLEKMQKGNIFLDGVNIARVESEDRKISLMFQDYALFPHITVENNLKFACSDNLDKKSKEDIVNYWMDKMNLSNLANSYPKELSGGEKQRTALARCLIGEPSCILLDEPFSALDAHLKKSVIQESKEAIKVCKCPVLIVSHNINDLYHMADRIILINDKGKIEQFGKIGDIYKNPKSPFVASMLGDINILDFVLYKKHLIKKNTQAKRQSIKSKKLIGFRLEDAKIYKNKKENSIKVIVDSKIDLGKKMLLQLDFQGHKLHVSIENMPFNLKINQEIFLVIDSYKVFN